MSREVKVNPENRKVIIRKILVPIDESTHSRAALEAAITMAAALQAEISALFVEDAEVLEIARHPFFREVRTYEFSRGGIAEIERDLRLQAERIRKWIARSAGSTEVTWKFEVIRGGVKTIVLEQAATADLTIMGRFGRTVFKSTIGSTARHLILHGRGLTMLIDDRFRLIPPVLSTFTGSVISERALEIGANVARLIRSPLEVLIPAEDHAHFLELKKKAETVFTNIDLRIKYHPIHAPASLGLTAALQTRRRQLLVLPGDAADHQPEDLVKLVNRISNPVLLVC